MSLYLARQGNGNYSVWSDKTHSFAKTNISPQEARETGIRERIAYGMCLRLLKQYKYQGGTSCPS